MYQPQLQNQYIQTGTYYSIKCWIETMIDEELPSEDLGQCLKDGRILCTLVVSMENWIHTNYVLIVLLIKNTTMMITAMSQWIVYESINRSKKKKN